MNDKRKFSVSDLPEHVPEEFFRRFTDTDSRPLTPTPTVISGKTRNSAAGSMMNARRCVTPEPSSSNVKERKQIILDLRRSHSQETIYWNASSELSPGPTQEIWSAAQNVKKLNAPIKKIIEKVQPIIKTESIEIISPDNSQICINARDDSEEDDQPRRRGKKRKKSKTQSAIATTFIASQDPETQVATIGLDSPNLSNRPSLVPNGSECNIFHTPQSKFNTLNLNDEEKKSNCFLDETSLTILRRGINLDVVESSFEKNVRINFIIKKKNNSKFISFLRCIELYGKLIVLCHQRN